MTPPGQLVVVRAARADDLAAIAALFLSCWHETYAVFLPMDVIDLYDADGARALWRPALHGRGTDASVLVAEQAGHDVLGVARVGTDPDEPAAGHIFSLYVRPDTHGLGVGTRLLAAAAAQFRQHGLDQATLWVFAANAAARRFYARLGWQPDGGERIEPQYGQPEVRLRRTVRA